MKNKNTNKIIVVEFVTLDGVLEDPDGSWGTSFGGWGFRQGPQAFAGDKFRLGPILDTGALLFGRATWELFAQRWPTRTGGFADAMNRALKLVATRTLASVEEWSNSALLDGELGESVERLRADRDVVVPGSTSIVRQLAAGGLVDEYRLVVFPTVVGAGARLFDGGPPADLELVSADIAGPTVLLRYDVIQPGPGADDGAVAVRS
jgi:dihydrofolate reductase